MEDLMHLGCLFVFFYRLDGTNRADSVDSRQQPLKSFKNIAPQSKVSNFVHVINSNVRHKTLILQFQLLYIFFFLSLCNSKRYISGY